MTTNPRWIRAFLLSVATFVLSAADLAAQDGVAVGLRGRVIDSEGRPVPGTVVAAHRVTDQGGAEVARATTGEDGGFILPIETTVDGIYFIATRYEGALYMGATFRDLGEVTGEYVIAVGRNPVALGGPAVMPGPPPEPAPAWPILLVLGIVGVGAVLLPLRGKGRGTLAARSLLLELAELEERRATGIGGADVSTEGEALRARLREITRTGP